MGYRSPLRWWPSKWPRSLQYKDPILGTSRPQAAVKQTPTGSCSSRGDFCGTLRVPLDTGFTRVSYVNGVEDIINQQGHQVHYTKKWSYGEFLFFIEFHESLQVVLNCCFGAQWFGFLTSPYERDCYLGASLESPNHRAPNHQLTISWFNVLSLLYLYLCF